MKNPNEDNLPTYQAELEDSLISAASTRKHWFSHVVESRFLFPLTAIVVLAAIWGTTLNLIQIERTTAEQTAIALSHELILTYESQIVRALREIDQTLKIVKSAYEDWGEKNVLALLKARNLLPPTLVFDVTIADNKGEIVESTAPKERAYITDQNLHLNRDQVDVMSIVLPPADSDSGPWHLHFRRGVSVPDGKSSGMVIVTVDAAYFVSGYENSNLGEHGMLGIIGNDDIFLVWRSGKKKEK